VVRARGVDAVLIGDDLPELGTNLVAALATLDVDDLCKRRRGGQPGQAGIKGQPKAPKLPAC